MPILVHLYRVRRGIKISLEGVSRIIKGQIAPVLTLAYISKVMATFTVKSSQYTILDRWTGYQTICYYTALETC